MHPIVPLRRSPPLVPPVLVPTPWQDIRGER
jgi:hypothetical protein